MRGVLSRFCAPAVQSARRAISGALALGLLLGIAATTPAFAVPVTPESAEAGLVDQHTTDEPAGQSAPDPDLDAEQVPDAVPEPDAAPESELTPEPEPTPEPRPQPADPGVTVDVEQQVEPLAATQTSLNDAACVAYPNSYFSLRQSDRGGVGEGEATSTIDLHTLDPRALPKIPGQPYGKFVPALNGAPGWPVNIDTPTTKPSGGGWGGILSTKQRRANALGVSDDGYAYFTYQYKVLHHIPSYYGDFVDVWRVKLDPADPKRERVAQHILIGAKGEPIVSAGGVNPVDGKYYFALLMMDDANMRVLVNVFRFDPATGRLETGSAGERSVVAPLFQAQIVPGDIGWASASASSRDDALAESDLAFGADGTMFVLVQGKIAGGATLDTQVGAVSPEQFLDVTVGIPGTTTQLNMEFDSYHQEIIRNAGVEGFAITNTGGITMQRSSDKHQLRHPYGSWFATFAEQDFSYMYGKHDGVRDLASCSPRVYVSMNMSLTAPRIVESDQFTVQVTAQAGNTGTLRPTTDATGTTTDALTVDAPQSVFRASDGSPGVVGAVGGDYLELKTSIAGADSLGDYGVQHVCYNTSIPEAGKPGKQVYKGGDGGFWVPTAVSQNKPHSGVTPRVQCESQLLVPNLSVAKTTKLGVDGKFVEFTSNEDPVTDRVIHGGSELEYKLLFGNETGTKSIDIDYVDRLHDVCDDVRSDGPHAWLGTVCTASQPVEIAASAVSRPRGWTVTGSNQELRITGTLPMGAHPANYSLSYRVKVIDNSVNAEKRGESRDPNTGVEGYVMRNYLVPSRAGAPDLTECDTAAPPAETTRTACTEHPISAWTLEKTSQPHDGAWLHSGGNVYYRVNVTKVGDMGAHLTGINVHDDMSQVLAVARLDPGAPSFGGDQLTGIRFFDASGAIVREIDASQELGKVFTPEWHGGAITDPTDPAFDPQWSLGITPFELRSNEVRAEIAYSVKVGGYADPKNPQEFIVADDGSTIAPEAFAAFGNTIEAGALAQTGPPNRCAVGSLDPIIDPACQVHHQLADNYFHVQKNSSSSRPGNPVWNIGGEFVLGDGPISAADAQLNTWSKNICRTDNYVDAATGAQTAPAGTQTGNSGVQPSNTAINGGNHSGEEILNSIEEWNAAHPDDQRHTCGLFYKHLVDADSNAGTWHAEEIAAGSYLLYDTVAADGHLALAEPVAFNVAGASDPASGATLADGLTGLGKLSIRIDAPLTAGQVRPPAGTVWDAAAVAQWQLSDTSPAQNLLPTCDWLGSPTSPPSDGSPACVMTTGWLLQVYEPKEQMLPFTGGGWPWAVTLGSVLMGGLAVGLWWRRRQLAAEIS